MGDKISKPRNDFPIENFAQAFVENIFNDVQFKDDLLNSLRGSSAATSNEAKISEKKTASSNFVRKVRSHCDVSKLNCDDQIKKMKWRSYDSLIKATEAPSDIQSNLYSNPKLNVESGPLKFGPQSSEIKVTATVDRPLQSEEESQVQKECHAEPKETLEQLRFLLQQHEQQQSLLRSELEEARYELQRERLEARAREEDLHEKIDSLDREIFTLTECVEVSDSHTEELQDQIMKERGRADLIRSELLQQEKFWRQQLEIEKTIAESAYRQEEETKKIFAEQRETLQQTLKALKGSLEEKMNELTKSEESNEMLRNELMGLMLKFGKEKQEIENRIEKYKKECTAQTQLAREKTSILSTMETENFQLRRDLDSKTSQVVKLKKIVLKLVEELETFKGIDERCFTIAKILHHIDTID